MDKFLIFGLERSGTTSLAVALDVNGSLVHEPFSSQSGDIEQNPAFARILEANGYLDEPLPRPVDDEYGFNRYHFIAADVDRCRDYLGQLYTEFTGVKHIWNTVSKQANLNILIWCRVNGIKLIFQTRENPAHSLISNYLAEQAQIWQLGTRLQHKTEWQDTRFRSIDLDQFKKDLRFRKAELVFYRDQLCNTPHYEVTFERLFLGDRSRQEKLLGEICNYLSTGIGDLKQESLERWIYLPERRQTTRELVRKIPNYQELSKFL